ncbi:GDSL-type esterase/lipase family protein [Bifidobacterium sp. ESL0763]|uniref:SGNH/GDSL hydrolase family protein n=1 Tax=Bifidobacterium sp. ESL0763 TaxID=2983227 RepID=UPI0023F6AE9C|nr:GDSL-type esterase/lipase family protein [Bifidobacterium sp. ESL0763]MDF7663733.1 GDSL-type esterase/lipase family protein [Bifidobacterium sp. ESL0763]
MTLGIGTPVASIEALWAKHTVHLAQAPAGDPFGVKPGRGGDDGESAPITMCAIGDSMVAGCGTRDQSEGFVPDIAEGLARRLGRDVHWRAYGKLGATMRRVRYRLIPEARKTGKRYDLLVLCAGSNDIMANRTLDEWRDDLAAVLDEARPLGERIVVLSPGQMQHEPSLGRALRRALEHEMDAQAAVSQEVCRAHGATYVNMIHEDVHAGDPDFFSPDHFHPGVVGYRHMADGVVERLMAMRA